MLKLGHPVYSSGSNISVEYFEKLSWDEKVNSFTVINTSFTFPK
jgi:hypothetical protein